MEPEQLMLQDKIPIVNFFLKHPVVVLSNPAWQPKTVYSSLSPETNV
jgi:hypothetical protein